MHQESLEKDRAPRNGELTGDSACNRLLGLTLSIACKHQPGYSNSHCTRWHDFRWPCTRGLQSAETHSLFIASILTQEHCNRNTLAQVSEDGVTWVMAGGCVHACGAVLPAAETLLNTADT